MGLRDRLDRTKTGNGGRPAPSAPLTFERKEEPAASARHDTTYQQIKLESHRRLIERLDSSRMGAADSPAARRQIRQLLERLVEEDNPPLNQEERRRLVQELEYETFGLGPLEPLLHDSTIDDILVNQYDEVYIERSGRLERVDAMFRDNDHLLQVIERIVTRAGRRIDESSPMVDARLPDGSRVNAIIPPLAVDGPSLSIRRVKANPITMDDLLKYGSANPLIASILEAAVKAKLNILISGGSGSGKTTLLNVIVRYIGRSERLVSIEDTVELQLRQLHVVRLETRPQNIEHEGEVTQRDLLRNALRMRPDRIIVGEVRGPEAFDMLQAMNTGHKGSLTTIHANSPRDALARLETMILMAAGNLTHETMRRHISSAIDVVVQLSRFRDGVRRIVSISEVMGLEEQVIKLQEILRFQERKSDRFDKPEGEFVTTGVLPAFLEQIQMAGIQMPGHLFARPAHPEFRAPSPARPEPLRKGA